MWPSAWAIAGRRDVPDAQPSTRSGWRSSGAALGRDQQVARPAPRAEPEDHVVAGVAVAGRQAVGQQRLMTAGRHESLALDADVLAVRQT